MKSNLVGLEKAVFGIQPLLLSGLLALAVVFSSMAWAEDQPSNEQAILTHTVEQDETLWRIASHHVFDDVSVWRMLISIYQLNMHAFIDADVARLKTGSALMIPNARQITSLSTSQAEAAYQGLMIGEKLPPKFILPIIVFTGNRTFSSDKLHALVAHAEGTAVSLEELNQLVARVTQLYQDNGYSIARAMLPAQGLSAGQVTINVVEPVYGEVAFSNDSKVDSGLLKAMTKQLRAGDVIADDAMYNSLLLLSDVPGLVVNSSLSPGAKAGQSDLTVVIEDAKPYKASVSLDQHGDKYMGKERLTASVDINNLAGHGDVLSISAMTTSGDMGFVRVAYDWLLNAHGAHIGAGYSGLNYALGADMAASQAHGKTNTVSAWLKQPLQRGLKSNANIHIQVDENTLKDHIDSSNLKTDRTVTSATLTLSADRQTTTGLGGSSSANLSLKSGSVGFDNSAAQTADASAANTKGSFAKVNLNLSHLQALSDKASIYVNLVGQWAGGNLDSSEKFSAGGVGAVRAYGSGALSGDEGHLVQTELRYQLGPVFDGELTGKLFYDYAHIRVNNDPWPALTSANSAKLGGAGLAFDWQGADEISVSLLVAKPTGSKSTLVTNHPDSTVWIQVSKEF